jgi:hypothetical protein
MIAIIDGVIIQGDDEEICRLLIRKTRSIDELQSNLDVVLRQQRAWTAEEQALLSDMLERASVDTGISAKEFVHR